MINTKEKAIEEAVKNLTDAVNVLGHADLGKMFSDEIQKQHRTLQQGIWRCIVDAAGFYKEAKSDPRNCMAVEVCKQIYEATKNMPLPFI